MSAGPKYEYQWMDGVTIKKPIACSAPQYVEYLMKWIQDCLDNDKLFPTSAQVPFPKHFESVVKQIFKRLFRVYAHVYHAHFNTINNLGASQHLNTSFKHFVFFILEFKLVEKKELAPLQELIDGLASPK